MVVISSAKKAAVVASAVHSRMIVYEVHVEHISGARGSKPCVCLAMPYVGKSVCRRNITVHSIVSIG